VAAALLLQDAQLRPDPLGRDMPLLSQLIDAVTRRHEEVAVACRLPEAFDGAVGWTSHIRQSRNRAGCSREEWTRSKTNFSVRPDPQPRPASSSPVVASVSSMLERWVVALASFRWTKSASCLIVGFGCRSMCRLGIECRGFPSRAARGSPQHSMSDFCDGLAPTSFNVISVFVSPGQRVPPEEVVGATPRVPHGCRLATAPSQQRRAESSRSFPA
jgi:hypothetical protein